MKNITVRDTYKGPDCTRTHIGNSDKLIEKSLDTDIEFIKHPFM